MTVQGLTWMGLSLNMSVLLSVELYLNTTDPFYIPTVLEQHRATLNHIQPNAIMNETQFSPQGSVLSSTRNFEHF